jgi:DNA end-binding protein Ku
MRASINSRSLRPPEERGSGRSESERRKSPRCTRRDLALGRTAYALCGGCVVPRTQRQQSEACSWITSSGDEVEANNIVKGYEVGKGEYIELESEELEAAAIESKRTIEIDEFVRKKDIDELYIRDPYYIVPDGEVGQQAFAVISEAIRQEGIVGLVKIVFTSREHMIALEARGKGLLGITLRYPYEVQKEKSYFYEIADEKEPKEMLDLAMHIVDTKRVKFEPQKFEDYYEDALKGASEEEATRREDRSATSGASNVVNLMDALRVWAPTKNALPPGRCTSAPAPLESPRHVRRPSGRRDKSAAYIACGGRRCGD